MRLRDGATVDGPTCGDLPPARWNGDQPCPGCETRRKRLEPAGPDPAVWYDTFIGDWVVRMPGRGLFDGALVPLDIGWFDPPWAEVYRAAADIAYGGDAFET